MLRQSLKKWERDFLSRHGRKPTKADVVEAPEDMKYKYQYYRDLKKMAPSRLQSDEMERESSGLDGVFGTLFNKPKCVGEGNHPGMQDSYDTVMMKRVKHWARESHNMTQSEQNRKERKGNDVDLKDSLELLPKSFSDSLAQGSVASSVSSDNVEMVNVLREMLSCKETLTTASFHSSFCGISQKPGTSRKQKFNLEKLWLDQCDPEKDRQYIQECDPERDRKNIQECDSNKDGQCIQECDSEDRQYIQDCDPEQYIQELNVESDKRKETQVKQRGLRSQDKGNYVRLNMKRQFCKWRGCGKSAASIKRQQWRSKLRKKLKGGSSTDQCFVCHKEGHWASQCPNRTARRDVEIDNKMKKSGIDIITRDSSSQVCSATSQNLCLPDVLPLTSDFGDSCLPSVLPSVYKVPDSGCLPDTPPEVFDALVMLGFTRFRPGQVQAVMRVLCGLSSLVVLPTGSGKSLCYQLPAYLYARRCHCITLVISPLVSLMEDQVRVSIILIV
jgi:hypothetical protein